MPMIDQLEFHDSTLLDVVHGVRDLVLEIDAYVHRVMIRDGREADTGWVQRLRLVVSDGRLPADWPDLPDDYREIYGGTVRTEASSYADLVPVNLEVVGDVSISIELLGQTYEIEGTGLRIERVGEPRYVEDIPWERPET